MKKVYEVLQEVDTNFPSPGICAQIYRPLQNNIDWFIHREKAFRSWPKYSGNFKFPVPYKILGVLASSPERAYYTREKWAGRYGRDRRELLVHLIQWFKERDL